MNRVEVGTALAAGLSLANLCFIGVWSDLLPFLYGWDSLPVGGMPCWRDFAAVVLNVLAASVPLAGAAYLSQRGTRFRTAADLVLLAALAVSLNAVRYHFRLPGEYALASVGRPAAFALIAVAVTAALAGFWWRRRYAAAALHVGLLVMSPLVPMQFAQAAWAMTRAGGDMRCAGADALAPPPVGLPARRVIMIVYDELEHAAVFDARPPDLALPAFDALRAGSVMATAMTSPASRTERAIPSVLTGRAVRQARLTGRDRLELTFADGGTAGFTAETTLFARARDLGVASGLAGFFLPYCSMLAGALTTCTWQPCLTCGRRVGAFGGSLPESVYNQISELAARYGPRRHLRAYRALQQRALELAADPAVGLAFVHLPVPHDPSIYDRHTREFSLWAVGRRDYHDNVALADRSLGEILRALDASNLASRTTVIVFGDHGRRSLADGMTVQDPRVLFLVRLPGQRNGSAHAGPLDLTLVHDLALAALTGRIASPDALTAWLNGRTAGSPATVD